MAFKSDDLIDVLVIRGEVVFNEHGLPQEIGGRDVVAQDIGHRLENSGLVFLLIGERNTTAIKSLLLKIRLEVEEDLRVVPGSVKTSFDMLADQGILYVNAKTHYGDVDIAAPVIPEEYLTLPGEEIPKKILFTLPSDFGGADTPQEQVIDLGSADDVIQHVVDLGSADAEQSTEGVTIYE